MKVELNQEQVNILKKSFLSTIKLINEMDMSEDDKIKANIVNNLFLQALHDAEVQNFLENVTRRFDGSNNGE